MINVRKAFVWSIMDVYFIYALKFVFALTIARILSPHDYGLIAYTSIFMTVASYFAGVGFAASLVQKKNPSEVDYSTGFYFNLAVNLFFVVLYFVFAGPIAHYFNEPDLKLIFRVSSLNLITNALFSIHNIKLTKVLKFKEHALINFFSTLFGSIIGLVWALVYADYWALVYQTFSSTLFKMIGYWYFSRWKPSLYFSWKSWYNQFKFGSKVFIQGIVETLSRESYTYFIGKFHSTEFLGIYNRTLQFYNLFVVQLSLSFNKVLYPAMAQYVTEDIEKKRVYLKSYLTLFAIFAPLSLFFYMNSQHIVIVLLSNKWVSVIPFLKILFLGGFVYALTHFNSTALLSLNKSGVFLRLEIVNKTILFIALLLTFKISVEYILYGWLIAQYVVYLMSELTLGYLGYAKGEKYYKMLLIILAIIPTVIFHYIINQYSKKLYLVSFLEFLFLGFTYFMFLKYTLNEVIQTFASILKFKKTDGENNR